MRTNHANRFSTELSTTMSDTSLEASVLTTAGGPASPCYLVIDHDVATKAEIILFDGTFDGTTFRTTELANRYLEGSAASSGITHDAGAKVISAPLGTSLEDIWDQFVTHSDDTSAHEAADSGNVLGGTSGASTGVAVGPTANTDAQSVAVGNNADTGSVGSSVAVGDGAVATGGIATAVGKSTSAAFSASSAFGQGATATASDQIRMGTDRDTTSIPGALSVAGTKNFEIPHPADASRTLRHGAYEGPVPGGTIYRYRVTTEDGQASVELPDYFAALNKDVDVHVSPVRHFGRAYGDVNGQRLTVTAEADGEYAVLILGTRDDTRARRAWEVYAETKPADRMWNGRRPDEVPARR